MLVLDKPAPFDFTVQTSAEASTATGNLIMYYTL